MGNLLNFFSKKKKTEPKEVVNDLDVKFLKTYCTGDPNNKAEFNDWFLSKKIGSSVISCECGLPTAINNYLQKEL